MAKAKESAKTEITEKILLQMSNFGTISNQGLNIYINEEN